MALLTSRESLKMRVISFHEFDVYSSFSNVAKRHVVKTPDSSSVTFTGGSQLVNVSKKSS